MSKHIELNLGRGVKTACLSGLLALAAGGPLLAEDGIRIATDVTGPVAESGLTIQGDEVQLTVEDAVSIALERNLGLLVKRYDRQQFELQIDEATGIYDLNLNATTTLTEETSPAVTELDGAEVVSQETANFNVNASQLTPWGGTGSAIFNTFKRDTNSSFSNLNPVFSSGFDLRFSQPLLRDFGRAVTNRGIEITRLNNDMNREAFEQQITATIQQVVNAYFTLVEARAQVEVSRESRELAVELHDMNKVRVEVGTLAPLELITSEVGIATREEEIIQAEQRVGDAEDDLRSLLNLEEGALWDTAIVPHSTEDPARVTLELTDAITTSLKSRPEIRSKKLELERLGVDAEYWHNQVLPSLNATLTYGYNGIGGDLIERDRDGNVINVTPGGFSDSLDQILDRDFDGWRFEVTFGMPIQNRAAKSRRAIADLDADQGRIELAELTQSIRTEVRKAVRAVTSAEKQIDSARASVRLAEKNLDAERKRYENGLSTSYQVLEIQEDLSQARSREVSALATYRRALAEYYRATGTLLETSGVEWAEGSDVE